MVNIDPGIVKISVSSQEELIVDTDFIHQVGIQSTDDTIQLKIDSLIDEPHSQLLFATRPCFNIW